MMVPSTHVYVASLNKIENQKLGWKKKIVLQALNCLNSATCCYGVRITGHLLKSLLALCVDQQGGKVVPKVT